LIHKIYIVIIIIFIGIFLNALTIPYSDKPLISDQNQINDFLCSIPPDSTKIELETKCWIWHDNNYLNIYWEAETDENFIIGKYSSNDVSAQADQLSVQIITDLTNYYSYGFMAYPLENKTDFVRSFSHDINYDWNSNYEYSSTNQNSKWTVMMKIPFKDLRFNGKPPYHWKIILSRYLKNDDKHYIVPYITAQMGKDYFRDAIDITINEEIRNNSNFYIRPFSIIKADLLDKKIQFDSESFGLDFSLKPTSSTKLKLTYNPDFSDIPIDDETNDFNSKYAPSYAENRYFFIKDFNVLGVNSTTFYSRQIVQPDFAVKFTGKTGNLTYGALSSKVKQVANSSGFIVNSKDIYNIVAVKPATDHFNLQFTILNRMNENYHNEVLHIKPNWEFIKDQCLWFDINLSTKKSIGEKHKNGYYGIAGYDYKNDEFSFTMSATQMSKNYSVDMGKIYEDDYYGWNFYSTLRKEFINKFFRSITTNINTSEEINNTTSKLLERYARFALNLNSNNNFDIDFYGTSVKELSSDKYFDKYHVCLQLTWEKSNLIKSFFGFSYVNDLIYKLNDDYKARYLQFGIRGVIDKYFSYIITADNIFYFNLQETEIVDDNYWLSNIDISFSLSNDLSLTSGIRFNNYETSDHSQHIGIFSNLRWQFLKQSHIYLGYNSANNKINGKNEFNYQQAYFKISYLF